ncbi:hypothetical protein F5B21DRAFT_510354 [Xylaria acuta]|nr:hypothetical protein F5B21DRAFT_510354 [Xylaria acuta]
MEDDALREHFWLLRDQAIDRGSAAGVFIGAIVLIYLSYLYETEIEGDIDRYTLFYINLMRPLWSAYAEANDLNILFETGRAVGGSYSSKEATKDLIRADLAYGWPLTEISHFIKLFEDKKLTLDPDNMPPGPSGSPKPLELIGSDRRKVVVLTLEHLQNVFCAAFAKGVDVFQTEIWRLVLLGKDFAVVFCGGSYFSLWLRRVVGEYMEEVKIKASQRKKPVQVRYVFLTDHDSSWPSAVSAGAAVCAMGLPPPAQNEWVPSSHAQVLLSKGCVDLTSTTYEVPLPRPVRFRLVCDPNNYRKTAIARIARGSDGTQRLRPFFIDIPERVFNGPLSTYDLGFEVRGTDLPPGTISFSVTGRSARRVAMSTRTFVSQRPDDRHAITPRPSPAASANLDLYEFLGLHRAKPVFRLGLSCYQVDEAGQRLKHDLDKRWELALTTDLASKLLIVSEAKEMPVWCCTCGELIRLAYTCPTCPKYYVCDGCFDNDPDQQAHEGHSNFTMSLIETE